MKKIYLLCAFFCVNIAAFAQVTDTIYAGGDPVYTGTYITGSAIKTGTAYARADNIIPSSGATASTQAGYAVFDLSIIPANAVISAVTLGANLFGFTNSTYGTCTTYGRQYTDLSTETNATTLFTDCTSTTFGNPILIASATTSGATGSYNTGVTVPYELTISGTTVPNLLTMVSNVANNLSSHKVSITFSGGGTNVYNFTGEVGSKATAGPHAPYLIITYCYKPTGVSAVVSPTTICTGQTFSLTGTASGASSYKWIGPAGSGYIATTLNASGVASAASGGAYTLRAYTSCGLTLDSTVASTVPLTVLPSPAAITSTTTTVCSGNTIYMTDATVGGVWSSTNVASASVTGGTVVAGAVAGMPVISYTLSGQCAATYTLTVNNPPDPIGGPVEVCASGGLITLSDDITGGTWSSGGTGTATVDPVSGVVTGVTPGPVNINYVTGGCNSVTYPITVDPLPTNILGGAVVCVNAQLPLSDATTPGAWSSGNTAFATVSPAGVITGVAAGTVNITYTLPTGCYVTKLITINPIPDVITGPSGVCIGLTVDLSDATGTGTWSSSDNLTATVVAATGVVSGVASGVANISYILPVTGCYIIHPMTVSPLPDPISGQPVVCAESITTLGDDITGGNWSSESTAIATVDPNTGDVTGVSGGSTAITYTIGSTGCFTTLTVTVNALPIAVITPAGTPPQPTTFCVGGSVTLDATTGAGYSYQWLSNGNPVGTNAPTYTSVGTELITLRVTDLNNCSNTSAGTQVTLIPAVTIAAGGPVVFCQTGNVVLSVPLAAGIIYKWQLNGADITGANSNTYDATLNGLYTCVLQVPLSCSSTTPAFNVTVHPLPLPVISYGSVDLTTTNNYLSYQWFVNSFQIPGATTDSVLPTVNGSYRVKVLDGNGCSGYSNAFYINNLAVGSITKPDIKIYPNPANTIVHIVSPVVVKAVITDMEGKTLMEQIAAKDMDISGLPDGLYIIMLYDNDGNKLVLQKLVKE